MPVFEFDARGNADRVDDNNAQVTYQVPAMSGGEDGEIEIMIVNDTLTSIDISVHVVNEPSDLVFSFVSDEKFEPEIEYHFGTPSSEHFYTIQSKDYGILRGFNSHTLPLSFNISQDDLKTAHGTSAHAGQRIYIEQIEITEA